MLEIYTDGACKVHENGDAGWAVVIPGVVEFGGYIRNSTNNRAELAAVKKALEWCVKNNQKAVIYSDSTYVVNGLNKWCRKWSDGGWSSSKSVKNKDIWVPVYELFKKSECKVKWIKGHNGIEGNELADNLARECMESKIVIIKDLNNEVNLPIIYDVK